MEEKQGLVHRRGGGRIVQNMMKMLKIEKDLWSASKKLANCQVAREGKQFSSQKVSSVGELLQEAVSIYTTAKSIYT